MASEQSFDVSVVIPAYNEEQCIRGVLKKVVEAVRRMPKRCEIIVINDHSTDRTREIVQSFADREGVVLLETQSGHGKGAALRRGFEVARGKCLIMMDGDGSHQAVDIPRLVEEQERTGGLVIGSRIYGGSEEYTRVRAFGNLLFTWLFGFLHGRYLSDALNGFKAFHADIFRSFIYTSNGYEIEIELLVNALALGRPITEIPSLELSRQGGEAKSKVLKDGFRFLFRIVLERFRVRRRRENPR